MRRLFIGISSVAACTFPRPPDVSDDVPIDAAVDARPDLVRGRAVLTTTVGPPVDEGQDLSVFTAQALIPTASEPGGFTTVTGVARADGTFEIEGVPAGVRYVLKLNRAYYVTDQHELTIRDLSMTRGGVRVAAQSTPVTFEVTSLPVTEDGDSVGAESVQLAIDGYLWTPTPGSSQSSFTWDWIGSFLVEASRGDELMLVQHRTTPATRTAPAIERIVASGTVPMPTIADGQPVTFTAALTTPATNFTISSGVNRTSFEAGHSPIAKQTSMTFRCAAVGTSMHQWPNGAFLSGLTIISAEQSDWRTTTSMAIVGDFPDPYPSSLPRLCSQTYVRKRPVRAPGATTSQSLNGGASRIRAIDISPIVPLAPPSAIRINGNDGEDGGVLVNDGDPIELTWSGVAQATQYGVVITQITRSGTQTGIRAAASITTDQPHLTLPALALSGSEFIVFQITAINASNRYAEGELNGSGLTGSASTAVTAMFRYSATCGNGTVDLGEDCDGANASCDVDCTAAMCGDGTRNAAAGEICDSIEDTIGCDDDCTPNVCGDGHVNINTEQCDDGGTTSGDGCSASCRTE